MSMSHTSRVSHGKPHTSGRGWHITLDCGHTVYMSPPAPVVGAELRCKACELAEMLVREQSSLPRDISTITEYGLTQKLSNSIRCF